MFLNDFLLTLGEDLSEDLNEDSKPKVKLKGVSSKDVKLLFTDTDSLSYEIITKDVYEDFLKDKDLFDNSDPRKR